MGEERLLNFCRHILLTYVYYLQLCVKYNRHNLRVFFSVPFDNSVLKRCV